MPRPTPTAEYVLSILEYDPETGLFRWKVPRNSRWLRRKTAGALKPHGYVMIGIDGQRYYAHRLAWLIMTGKWPKEEIDHRDRNRSNNKWENLREATHSQNQINLSRRNKTGMRGVSRQSKCDRWKAAICVNGSRHHLGTFKTKEAAAEAYQEAAKRLHGEYALLQPPAIPGTH